MKKLILLFCLFLTVATQASQAIVVKVNGLVCSFCAQGIKQRVMKIAGVQAVQVSLEKKTVIIDAQPNSTISDETIKKAINSAGYSVVDVKR